MLIIIRSIMAVGLFVSAGYMAYQGSEGWGWFLFCGILVTPSLSSKE